MTEFSTGPHRPQDPSHAEIQSRPFRVNAAMACERCVFGSGEHAEHCIARAIERAEANRESD